MNAREIALAALVALGSGGCATNCDDLQAICNLCLDPNQLKSCEDVVAIDTQDACAQGIANFGDVCR